MIAGADPWSPIEAPPPGAPRPVWPANPQLSSAALTVPRSRAWATEGSIGEIVRLATANDSIVAAAAADETGQQRLEAYDAGGVPSRRVRASEGAWCLDPRGPRLLAMSEEGDPLAWDLVAPTHDPVLWSHRFHERALLDMTVLGDALVVSALARETLDGPAPNVVVAVLQIPRWDDVNRRGSLRGALRLGELLAHDVVAAVVCPERDGLLLATAGHVRWAGWDLSERACLALPGLPHLLGARADGRSWMLAHTDDGPELRLLAPGLCESRHAVHEHFALADSLTVTADGGVVLVSPLRIQSFDPTGALRWKFSREGAADALVDAVGATLFTHGPALVAADPRGSCSEVWRAPASFARLGSVASLGDDVIVAAGSTLFALTR